MINSSIFLILLYNISSYELKSVAINYNEYLHVLLMFLILSIKDCFCRVKQF